MINPLAFLLAPARLRVLFWLLLAFTLVMAFLPHPPHTPFDRFGDKVEHMLAFFTLTFVADLAWRGAPSWKLVLWMAAIGAGIEIIQAIPLLHRDSDIRDLIADMAAVLIALGAARVIEPLADWLAPEPE